MFGIYSDCIINFTRKTKIILTVIVREITHIYSDCLHGLNICCMVLYNNRSIFYKYSVILIRKTTTNLYTASEKIMSQRNLMIKCRQGRATGCLIKGSKISLSQFSLKLAHYFVILHVPTIHITFI